MARARANRISGGRIRHIALPRDELAAIEFELYAVDVESGTGRDVMLARRVSRRRAKLAHDICASEMNRYDRIHTHAATMKTISSRALNRNCMISEGLYVMTIIIVRYRQNSSSNLRKINDFVLMNKRLISFYFEEHVVLVSKRAIIERTIMGDSKRQECL